MALYGYAGKILRLDLTHRKAIVLDTERYKSWGGGHGLGAALFWEFCKDKTIKDGRDLANGEGREQRAGDGAFPTPRAHRVRRDGDGLSGVR